MVKSLLPIGSALLSDSTPAALGTANAGAGSESARSDHVHAMPNRARGAYDAIVYIQDGDVIAEDATGAEISSGTSAVDCQPTMQAGMDFVENLGGGVFHVTTGLYKLLTPITIREKCSLVSMNTNTRTGYDGPMRIYPATGFVGDHTIIMEVRSLLDSAHIRGTHGVNGIYMNGYNIIKNVDVAYGEFGIKTAASAWTSYIENCRISYSWSHGFYGQSGFCDSTFVGVIFNSNFGCGSYFAEGCHKNIFVGCTWEWNTQYGHREIGSSSVGSGSIISGSWFDRSGYNGISATNVVGLVVNGCVFRRNAVTIGYDAHVRLNTVDAVFSANKYYPYESYVGGPVKPDYVYSIIGTNNIEFYESPTAQVIGIHKTATATRNSGTSTGTGSEQTIAHGLVAAPSKVVIVPTETGATVSAVWADGTNIYCTVTTGKAFNWSAEV